MKVYKDKELTQEVDVKTLDFGIVPAGESQKFEFYMHNNSKAWLREIQVKIGHSEVRVIDAPRELETGDMGVLVLEWNPSVTIKEGLKARFVILAKELWRPNKG